MVQLIEWKWGVFALLDDYKRRVGVIYGKDESKNAGLAH